MSRANQAIKPFKFRFEENSIYQSIDTTSYLKHAKVNKAFELGSLSSKSISERSHNLFDAICDGTLEKVSGALAKLKRKEGEINKTDDKGFAALHHATRSNNGEIVRQLLESGARIDVRSSDGRELVPLHIAARFNCLEAARQLVNGGADPSLVNSQGATPLHYAARRGSKQMASLLLGHAKVDLNARDGSNLTPLHFSCIHGNEEVCQLFLNRNADLQAKSSDLMTPLHFAVFNGNAGTAKLILQKVRTLSLSTSEYMNTPAQDQQTALHLAVEGGNTECVRLCLGNGSDVNARRVNEMTPLHIATMKGNLDIVHVLVEGGGDIKEKDSEMKTALHRAASFNRTEVVRFLLDKGAQIEAKDNKKRTPFLEAVANGNAKTVALLIQSGADVSATDIGSKNCLHLAVENEQPDTLNMLLEQTGARENLIRPDQHERVPLHYAAIEEKPEILLALLAKQSHISYQDENHLSPLHLAAASGVVSHVEALGQKASGVNERDDNGHTPLHKAAMYGHRKVCLALIRLGADVNCRDNSSWTPLMLATKSGAVKTAQSLLNSQAALDLEDNEGNTALHIAAIYGRVDITKLLLDWGANLIKRNKHDEGVFEQSVKHDTDDVVMEVIKHERWQEIMESRNAIGHTPMKILIEHFPIAASMIMDRCIKRSKHSTKGLDCSITYEFTLLDPGPKDIASRKGNRFFGPSDMVTHERQKLLKHPLVQRLLDVKWKSFGRYLFYLNFFSYLLFLIMFSVLVVTERASVQFGPPPGVNFSESRKFKTTELFGKKTVLARYMSYAIFGFMAIHILKEIAQMVNQRGRYFTDFTNYLELVMYTTSLFFMLYYVLPEYVIDTWLGELNDPTYLWVIGAVSVFLGYIILVLFFRRFKIFGNYVVMFTEVSKTVLRVLMVFSVFIVAFAIVFYVLFKEQSSYATILMSLVKVTVMFTGELEYKDSFVDSLDTNSATTGQPDNPFPEAAFVFCVLFVFIMTIVLVNLLIGLAVGDIDTIQQNATMNWLAMQVMYVADVEDKYPRMISSYIYKPRVTISANQRHKSRCWRLWYSFVGSEQLNFLKSEEAAKEAADDQYQEMRRQIEKTKKRVKSLATMMKAQNMLLTAIAKKIDPSLAVQDITQEDWIQCDSVDALQAAQSTDEENQELSTNDELTDEDLVRLDIREETEKDSDNSDNEEMDAAF